MSGRRKEGGMTFRRRNVEKREVCSCKEGGEIKSKRREKPKKVGRKRRSLSPSTLPTQTDNQSKSSRAITNGHSVPT